jgi:hypothetical protein
VAAIALWLSGRNGRHAHRNRCHSYEERGGGKEKSGLARRISKLSYRERRANPHGTSFQRHPGARRRGEGFRREGLSRQGRSRSADLGVLVAHQLRSPRSPDFGGGSPGRLFRDGPCRSEGSRHAQAVSSPSRLCRNRERNFCRNENGLPIASSGCAPSATRVATGNDWGRPDQALVSACCGQSSIRRYHFRTIAGTAHGTDVLVLGSRPGE